MYRATPSRRKCARLLPLARMPGYDHPHSAIRILGRSSAGIQELPCSHVLLQHPRISFPSPSSVAALLSFESDHVCAPPFEELNGGRTHVRSASFRPWNACSFGERSALSGRSQLNSSPAGSSSGSPCIHSGWRMVGCSMGPSGELVSFREGTGVNSGGCGSGPCDCTTLWLLSSCAQGRARASPSAMGSPKPFGSAPKSQLKMRRLPDALSTPWNLQSAQIPSNRSIPGGNPIRSPVGPLLSDIPFNGMPRRSLSRVPVTAEPLPSGSRSLDLARFTWRPLTLLWRTAVIGSEIAILWLRRYTEPDIAVRAAKFRRALIRLGPFYVKLGQALSTRPDILPIAYCRELSSLQDRMPPFPTHAALALIHAQLGAPASRIFSEMSAEPVAAASLGQVYRGRLHSGEAVAIKVQRPGVEANLSLDRQILRAIAGRLQRRLRGDTDLVGIVDELVGRMFEEMDYIQEGRNAEEFARLYCNQGLVKAPKIFWKFTSRGVLTMEWIDGFKLTDSSAFEETRVSPRSVVDIGVWCSLRQVLDYGFFHADPHPGNLAATRDGRLVYFDFGMMSHLSQATRYGLVRVLVHYVNKDGAALAHDFDSLGFLPKDRDLNEIGRALQRSMDQGQPPGSGGSSQAGMDFQGVMAQLSSVMVQFRFRLPTEFSLVIRALGSLEGTATAVSPNFKVVASAYPFVMARLLEDRSPQMRSVLRDILLFRNGAVRWNRVRRMISVLEAPVSEPHELDPQQQQQRWRYQRRPPHGVSQQQMAAAAEYLLDFVFSGQGALTRTWLTLDLIRSYQQGLAHLATPPSLAREASRENLQDQTTALQPLDVAHALQATARASQSSPQIWAPLVASVCLRSEFFDMVQSLGMGILRVTVDQADQTVIRQVSKFLKG